MMTMKAYAKKIQSDCGKALCPITSLLVIDDLGMVVDVLVKNGDLETVATVENYFDSRKLKKGQSLVRMIKSKTGAVLIQEDGGNWNRLPC